MDINKIKIGDKFPEEFNAIIEIPMGGHPVKYEIDKDSGALVVDRIVATAMYYPFHYGFIPHTLAEDGDPIDVVLLCDFPIIAGSVIKVRPIGVLKMEDESGRDEKIICVPVSKVDKSYESIKSYNELPKIQLDKIKHFFEHYKDLEAGKWVRVEEFMDIEEAKKSIVKSFDNYKS